MQNHPRTRRLRGALIGLPPLAVLFYLARRHPPDGREHAALAQFFGRFHPALVHFPIALIGLVLVLEIAGARTRRAGLRDAAGFVLGLAAIAAFAAAALGWLLAWSGGYHGPVVTRHLWSGLWLCLACLVCLALRRPAPARPGSPYAAGLAATVLLMVWTGHLGGQLSHGDTFLTEYLPGRFRAWAGLPPRRRPALPAPGKAGAGPAAGQVPFFQASIAPIFEEHCAVCHDANKQKGKLRLDTYEWVMSGGEDGPVIKPGDPKGSELYRRITLSPDDDDFMPSDGKPPLDPADVMRIQHWIATGAAAMTPDAFVPVVPGAKPAAPAAAPDYRPLRATIAALESGLGVQLVPRSQIPTDGLILRTATAPDRCGDAALARLAPVAALIVDAELARTAVTDAGVRTLGTFRNLQSVDLSHTAVTDARLGDLAALPRLRKLNLTATAVDAAGVASLRASGRISRLYYYQTKAYPAAAAH